MSASRFKESLSLNKTVKLLISVILLAVVVYSIAHMNGPAFKGLTDPAAPDQVFRSHH